MANYHEKSPYKASFWFKNQEQEPAPLATSPPAPPPSFAGIPLKYISLVTLAVQNAALAVLMHYSRVSAQPTRTYSAAAAVLATELLKGTISLAIAFTRVEVPLSRSQQSTSRFVPYFLRVFNARCLQVGKEVFRPDCWKLSIPAILYVIQNNLQFVAASNLDAATFQVSYQMKILTTAAFSVLLLRKKLTPVKWLALFFLALGVGIVQLQTVGTHSHGDAGHAAMVPFKGFLAVAAACFTSGLAGVYFEMVLKNSSGDLWIRNVQLSLFSLLPALTPIIVSGHRHTGGALPQFSSLFANFTVAAWATVATQVLGGLVTALVIKYADNIMKGFATSLSIVLSFLLSVALFHTHITLAFLAGATVVLAATWLYTQPDTPCGRRLQRSKSSEAPVLPFSSAVALAPHPQPFRPAPISVPPMQLGRRTPGGSPYSSPTSPTPEYRAVAHVYAAHAPPRSASMPSIVLSPPSPVADAQLAPALERLLPVPAPTPQHASS